MMGLSGINDWDKFYCFTSDMQTLIPIVSYCVKLHYQMVLEPINLASESNCNLKDADSLQIRIFRTLTSMTFHMHWFTSIIHLHGLFTQIKMREDLNLSYC